MRDFKFSFEPEIVKAEVVKSAKPQSSDEYSIWAYASTWDIDSDDCQITRGALEKAKDDLLTYNTVLFNHNYDRPVGRVVETKIDNKGLLVRIVISNSEADLIAKVKDGTLSKLSISGRALEWTMTEPDAEERSILQITVIKLHEVSIVSVPANKEARTISASISKSLFLAKMQGDDTEKSLLADLQILGGRLVGDDKAVVDRVLEFFKDANKSTMHKVNKQYTFTDTADSRPVFQLNLSDSTAVELGEGNTFRKQILKIGKWHHWAADNGQLEITKAKISELVKNFKAGVLDSVPVPLTHTSDPAKNTGVVKELIETDEGLDAVIEIRDESIVEKIRKGLITAISASFDPNYLLKKTKEFVGPVLLHAALVSEPYIKGMGKFVALSDEFEGREIVQLEDIEFDVKASLKQVFDILAKVQKHIEKTDTVDVEAAKKKDGASCKMEDGSEGQMYDGECKPITKKELNGEETQTEEEVKEPETKVEETAASESEEVAPTADVSLSDSIKTYEEYLRQGKVVPAQKEAFIALCDSMKAIQLTDSTVDVTSLIDGFMASQPKLVNFSEDGTVETPVEAKPTDAETASEMPADVKDFYVNKMHLSEEKAKEAWNHARESAEEAGSQKSTIFG